MGKMTVDHTTHRRNKGKLERRHTPQGEIFDRIINTHESDRTRTHHETTPSPTSQIELESQAVCATDIPPSFQYANSKIERLSCPEHEDEEVQWQGLVDSRATESFISKKKREQATEMGVTWQVGGVRTRVQRRSEFPAPQSDSCGLDTNRETKIMNI